MTISTGLSDRHFYEPFAEISTWSYLTWLFCVSSRNRLSRCIKLFKVFWNVTKSFYKTAGLPHNTARENPIKSIEQTPRNIQGTKLFFWYANSYFTPGSFWNCLSRVKPAMSKHPAYCKLILNYRLTYKCKTAKHFRVNNSYSTRF